MAKKDSKLAEEHEVPQKPTIEEVVQDAEVLKAQAALEDEEARVKAEEEAKIPEVEVDLDAEREKTKKEVTESVTKDVVEPLKQELIDLKKTLNPESKDEYEKFVEDFRSKNGADVPEWKVFAEFAKASVRAEQEQVKKESEEAAQTAKKQEESQATENFKVWQGQLQEMEDKEMLPKMVKPEAGDPGFDARVKLYGHMQATWKTATPSTNLWEVHAKYWKDEPKQPAGGDAPVSLGQGGAGGEDDKAYKYGEIHNGAKDLEGFILRELQKAGKAS